MNVSQADSLTFVGSFFLRIMPHFCMNGHICYQLLCYIEAYTFPVMVTFFSFLYSDVPTKDPVYENPPPKYGAEKYF